jgi:hypothetical protein
MRQAERLQIAINEIEELKAEANDDDGFHLAEYNRKQFRYVQLFLQTKLDKSLSEEKEQPIVSTN